MPIPTRPLKESDLPRFLTLLHAKAAFDGMTEALQATEDSLCEALFAERPLAFALVAETDESMATYD
jgi:hypothetical protein